ncbi:MAG: TetR family transcriptional regulator [Alphaproteobacteria bacterium]|nr:TetR family transcriptional regulator [Alphaproteobacteria bacterium]
MARKPQTRNPEQTKARILKAARDEFALKGLGGARVDVISRRAGIQKRMMYHYFGNKEALFQIVIEHEYTRFREAEAALEIERQDPVEALKKLVAFTWDYYIAHPEFITLVNSENLHKARHLKASSVLRPVNETFVDRMRALLKRGEASGQFRKGVDAVQLLITLSGVNYHYLTNQFTGEIVYGRKLMTKAARDERLAFNIETILRLVCKEGVM